MQIKIFLFVVHISEKRDSHSIWPAVQVCFDIIIIHSSYIHANWNWGFILVGVSFVHIMQCHYILSCLWLCFIIAIRPNQFLGDPVYDRFKHTDKINWNLVYNNLSIFLRFFSVFSSCNKQIQANQKYTNTIQRFVLIITIYYSRCRCCWFHLK